MLVDKHAAQATRKCKLHLGAIGQEFEEDRDAGKMDISMGKALAVPLHERAPRGWDPN